MWRSLSWLASRLLGGTTPSGMLLRPSSMMVRMAPAPSHLQWWPLRLHTQRLCVDTLEGTALRCESPPSPPPGSTIPVTLENSVCSKRPPMAGCPSMECRSIDLMWLCELCWPWCSSKGNMVLSPALQGLCTALWSSLAGSGGQYQSSVMGLLRVKDIATPEVKFLDRCKINCGEGVLQVHVRRSRM